MRWGLIARGEDRGLGVMTWELAKALQPDRVLLVDPQDPRFPVHHDRFPGAEVAKFDGHRFDSAQVLRWAKGLDVVYSAETFYDWTLPDRLAAQGVRTIVHGMPEFYRHGLPGHTDWQHPTAWWWPTSWLTDRIPAGPVVPVPVPDDVPLVRREAGGRLVVTHIVGHRAHADRNGTLALFGALRRTREPMLVRLWTQNERLPAVAKSMPRNVELEYHLGGTPSRWDMYEDSHVMVLPRRYGGLCLPAQEALACGLGLVMSDIAPNPTTWPCATLPLVAPIQQLDVPMGKVAAADIHAARAAGVLDELARNPAKVQNLQWAADLWASQRRWSVLAPVYRDRLAEVLT